jgi:predicted signal transduction protein with EAL and GGDEF domain
MPSAAPMPVPPDRVLLIGRNGTVLRDEGVVSANAPALEELLPALARLARRAISSRAAEAATATGADGPVELRASPLGPDRALCVIRVLDAPADDGDPWLPRSAFIERLQATIDDCRLRERDLALVVIELDGLSHLGRLLDRQLADRVQRAALTRLGAVAQAADVGPASVGQLGTHSIAMLLACAAAEAARACAAAAVDSLASPVVVGDAAFELSPYAGIATLGRDGSVASSLLAEASRAAADAMAVHDRTPRFASREPGTSRRPVTDLARELQAAIRDGGVGLRYQPRHDLVTGRRTAWAAYLRWRHPLRGEISAAECLSIAESTGLSKQLSRAMLESVARDSRHLLDGEAADLRISLGALRHHVLDADFAEDIAELCQRDGLAASRLELRISERTFIATDLDTLLGFADLGIQLIVDEVGRAVLPLERLAKAPLFGMQIDRAWVVNAATDSVSRRVCEAGIAVSHALGLLPIASGIDTPFHLDTLIALGCRLGMGDFYASAAARHNEELGSGGRI